MNNYDLNQTDMRLGDGYEYFEKDIINRFNTLVNKETPLFTTDAQNLWETYLNNLPEDGRQHYNCRCCKQFVEKYGTLVTINENGELESVLWQEDVPTFFKKSSIELVKLIKKSRIDGVFVSDTQQLGTDTTGIWSHLHVTLSKEMVNKSRLKTSYQIIAEKLEDYRTLNRALQEYSIESVQQALNLLNSEALYRSEKCLGVAKWLYDLHNDRNNTKNSRIRENITWLYVAKAPTGFCHVKSSMIGTLLDDISSGMSFESVSKRFKDKMNPLQYQRPQASPSVGNIKRGEEIVEKLGIQKSLERRFARLEELNCLWKPTVSEKQEQKSNGVFSHLMPKENKSIQNNINTPSITMTWRKFMETILPNAKDIEYLVKSDRSNYSAILTAEYEDAPPIIQWDREEQRNPFSWYVYSGGSYYRDWNLSTGYCKVTGICLQPNMWYGEYGHLGKSVFFILENAKDNRRNNGLSGNSLFPETLKSELHEIRSTIESYSRNAKLNGFEEASACGLRLQYNSEWDATFKITTNIGTGIYKLDRWD